VVFSLDSSEYSALFTWKRVPAGLPILTRFALHYSQRVRREKPIDIVRPRRVGNGYRRASKPAPGPYASDAASEMQPFSALFVGGLSNLISNVPSTQLLLSLASVPPYVVPKIAVEAGLAGNTDPSHRSQIFSRFS